MQGTFHSLPISVSVNAKSLFDKSTAPHRFGMQAIIHIHDPMPSTEASIERESEDQRTRCNHGSSPLHKILVSFTMEKKKEQNILYRIQSALSHPIQPLPDDTHLV